MIYSETSLLSLDYDIVSVFLFYTTSALKDKTEGISELTLKAKTDSALLNGISDKINIIFDIDKITKVSNKFWRVGMLISVPINIFDKIKENKKIQGSFGERLFLDITNESLDNALVEYCNQFKERTNILFEKVQDKKVENIEVLEISTQELDVERNRLVDIKDLDKFKEKNNFNVTLRIEVK